MIKTKNETKEYYICDGCFYMIGLSTEERNAGTTVEEITMTINIPWDVEGDSFEFHFHSPGTRGIGGWRDCFRYWAHNPEIMKISLKERETSEDEIDEFMTQMLYRSRAHSPGIDRPKVNVDEKK